MPARPARRFSPASRLAIGRACFTRGSPPGNSRSLITSISSSATPDLSGTLPWRSSFLAGILPPWPIPPPGPSVHDQPAGHVDRLPGHVGRLAGSQEAHHVGDILGRLHPAQRDLRQAL